jgi:hypothetical protein
MYYEKISPRKENHFSAEYAASRGCAAVTN